MNSITYCLRCGGRGEILTTLGSVTCPMCLGDGKPTTEFVRKVDGVPMKALCRVCHDGYSDEEFCFGRCCGQTMVEVPKHMWDALHYRSTHDDIDELIAKHGKPLIGE